MARLLLLFVLLPLSLSAQSITGNIVGTVTPGSMKFDVSLLKDTKITERVSVQFRAESFNLPNHPSFGNPAASVNTTSTFGRISATSIENRAVQFGMKLLF
jgi:hypothetical protein